MPARLIVASTDASADQLYAAGFSVPDPFAFVQEPGGRTAILLSNLEVDRGRKQAKVDVVEAYRDYEERLKKRSNAEPTFAEVVAAFARAHRATRPLVPEDFPLGLAQALATAGVEVKPVNGSFWAERESKSAAELRALGAAIRATEVGFERAFEVLGAARIRRNRRLEWGGTPLTSERLRAEIESAILFQGGVCASQSIVAGGEQACDPHERGHGPLRANELIILDVFPRFTKTGFFGDVTRTVVKGRATDAQRRMWEVCLEGQRRALRALKPGVEGLAVQDETRAFFTEQGYPTEQRDGRWVGFFHGLGHGLGLELHENPRIAKTTMKPGQVVTVEPGLYVPGIGGVRHEDDIVITTTGNRVLSKVGKPFEIA